MCVSAVYTSDVAEPIRFVQGSPAEYHDVMADSGSNTGFGVKQASGSPAFNVYYMTGFKQVSSTGAVLLLS